MKTHTSRYKEEVKKFGRQLDSKITYELDGETIELGNEDLNSITPSFESNILKSVMKQLEIDSNVDIPVGTEINYQFGVLVDGSFEYLDFGNYIVYKSEKQEDTRSWRITCYDKMLYAMTDYERLDVEYPVTIRSFIQAICNKLNLIFANASNEFVNYNKEISTELYLDSNGSSLGYTYRDVLDELAQVTASNIIINDDDELEIKYIQNDQYVENTVTGNGNVTLTNAKKDITIENKIQGKCEQEGTPTPDSPVEIKTVSGIGNLFDKNNANILNANVNNNNVASSNNAKTLYIPIIGGETYTISKIRSARFRVATTINEPAIGVSTAQFNGDIDNNTEYTITTNATANYLCVYFYLNRTDTLTQQEVLDSIQIEKSSTAHQYVPYGHWLPIKVANSNDTSAEDYQEQITLIDLNKYDSNNEIVGNYELCSIGDVKDLLTIKDGNAVITKNINKIVLNGSESYTQVNVVENNTMYRTTNAIFVGLPNNTTNYITNYFSTNTASYSSSTIGSYIYNNQFRMRVPSSITNINTWLATHNTNIYYKLSATETITLKGTYNISLYEGTNYITVYDDDLEPTTEIKYKTNTITETEVINEEYLKDINVNFGEKYGEINTVVFSRSAGADKIALSFPEDLMDDEKIAIEIADNQILNSNDRDQYINGILNQLYGFSYYLNDFSSTGITYLDIGDRYYIHIGDNSYSCVMFNDEINITQGLEENIHTDIGETSDTDYSKTDKTDRKLNETWIIANKNKGDITLHTSQISTLQDDMKNVYTIDQTNELIANAETGVTNTFSKAGGNNIFRNTGLWFEQSDNNNPYEFWNGIVARIKEEKASNMNALQLQSGTVYQNQEVPNGQYTVSFKYKKLIHLAQPKVYINDVEYELTEEEDTEFEQIIEVSAKYINIRFTTDINDSCEIYDLMVNAGTVKLAYSQNQNETTTDTVNISKGITITTSDSTTKFKANADGIRTLDRNDNVLTEFTDTGMTTKEAIIQSKSQIVGTLWQEVGEQTWITRL